MSLEKVMLNRNNLNNISDRYSNFIEMHKTFMNAADDLKISIINLKKHSYYLKNVSNQESQEIQIIEEILETILGK